MAMTTENVKVCLFNLIDKIHENKINNSDLLDWCGYVLMAKKQLSSKQIDECVSRSQTIDEFKELITSEIQNIPQIDPGVEQMIEAFKTDSKYASEYGEFESGNKKAFGFFMGQLKQSFKNVDPKQLSMILNEKLK
jgi:Asp-tRNA(Asn)/Glu-tRNA(Gln) amidotransferase B subunit